MTRIADRRYWQAVAEVCNAPQPAWVWRLGYAPAARRIVEALAAAPRTSDELAQLCGYSYATLKCLMSALVRLGQVEQRTSSRKHSNLWYLKGSTHELVHDVV